MSILTDRSQGGTSLNDGQIEIMVHRRCVMDDGLGVEEGEDGNGLIIRAKHWLHFGPKTEEPSLNRILGLQLFHEPTLLFSKFSGEFNDYNNKYLTNFSALNFDLPPNINLLTLKHIGNKQILIRLEHIFQAGEDANLSNPIYLNLQTIFKNLRFQKIKELMLAGNIVFNEVVDAENVKLKPMEIRTFMLTT
uniref:Glycosyl hydrolases family 38 C-terminal beta sandwich domain-containing protein n=1 Tax=Meloidogyne floridensis TaxID=298350 RepID=A0A915PEZ2_9BILA